LGFVTVGGCNPCDGQEYDVKQLHFHGPSEHTIDTTPQKDGHYPLELHIVHQKKGADPNSLNDLLFVVVLFYVQPDGGFPNAFLDSIDWNHAPSETSAADAIPGAVHLHKLNEAFRGEYYTYPGSLTTPTCDETVSWFIFKTPLGITSQQLSVMQQRFQNNAAFANGLGNNRQVQPLNDRKVIWVRKRLN